MAVIDQTYPIIKIMGLITSGGNKHPELTCQIIIPMEFSIFQITTAPVSHAHKQTLSYPFHNKKSLTFWNPPIDDYDK